MGALLLPLELLPAYVLGPLLLLGNVILLVVEKNQATWKVALEVFNLLFSVWIIWYRFTKGIEPFRSKKQKSADQANDPEKL
jgi:uncharacterized membrane protein